MNQEKKDLLSLRNLPARLGIGELLVAGGENDIPVLMSAGLLKALGRPTTTGSKYFATVDLQNFGLMAGQSLRRGGESLADQECQPAFAGEADV